MVGKNWWGTFEVEQGSFLSWRVGPLSLEVYRASKEWQVVQAWDESIKDKALDWQTRVEAGELSEKTDEASRYVFERPGREVSLVPALADRPVVTSPRMPLFLPPGQEASLFVGSPLWVRLETKSPAQLLGEFPIRRLSDTWFGPSTLEGEMCYASKTRAVLDPTNLPPLSRHAITPVLIRNRADQALRVESLKLPVPLLSLYEGPAGQLWTDGVTMDRAEESELARIEIQEKRAPQTRRARLLTAARETSEQGLLIRAFSGLFDH